jgi:hypothetical protein
MSRGARGGRAEGGVTCTPAIALQRGRGTLATVRAGAFTACGGSGAYGRHVSSAMENRAAVFTSEPQAVEVYQAGAWWSGELLGWRHSADGSCQVRVRVVLGGVEETAWTDLGTLRLPESRPQARPERHLAMAPEPAAAGAEAREGSVARHPSSRRERSSEVDASATAHFPAVRDLSAVPSGSGTGGRRRAPEVPAAIAGGRRRAPEEPVATPSGGRRRAPEEAQSSTGGRRRAPEGDETAAPGGSPLGRHRAHGSKGRHGADTGLLPVITDEAPAPRPSGRRAAPSTAEHHWTLPAARPARSEMAPAVPARDEWTPPAGLESELLTRPMRLSDHVPHVRRPRLDGSLRGV